MEKQRCGGVMLGYGEYWTCGFSASQWSAVLHPKDYNWVDFTFISLWFDRDRKMRDWLPQNWEP
jgi:hypothetical protein